MFAVSAELTVSPGLTPPSCSNKAAEAFRHMEQGKHFGKIVIDV